MIRELYEETGLKVEEDNLDFYKTFYVVYPDKNFLYHYFKLKIKKDFNVKLKVDEHQDFVWVTPTEALGMFLVLDEGHCLKDFYKIA